MIENHHAPVSNVFQLLIDNHMSVEIEKCIFDAKELPVLTFIVNGTGIGMDPGKQKAIVDWPLPTTQKEVQQWLGLCNYY